MAKPESSFDTVGVTSYETSFLMAQSGKAFYTLLATCLGHHGLITSEWSFLGGLYPDKTLRPTDLATELNLSPAYVTRILGDLMRKQYVTAAHHVEDARSKEYRLTQEGRALIERVEPMLKDCLRQQFAGLPAEYLRIYFETAQYIAQHVAHRS